MSRTIVLASGNPGKLREFERIYASLDVRFEPQSKWQVPDAEETGTTFEANALIKARHAHELTGRPAMADDSGLVVPALGDEPGVYSARYAGIHGDDEANNRLLLKNMANMQGQARRAYFNCTMAYVDDVQEQPLIVSARWWGEIVTQARGQGGFGYDPLFWLPDLQCTSAELAPEKKNELSHRGQAAAAMLKLLEPLMGVRLS